jgi:hypothetical protein
MLDNVLSPTLSLVRISVGFTFFSVTNLTIILSTTGKGTHCSLVITTDTKQVDMQQYVITVIGIPSLTTSKVILFSAGISLHEKNIQFIFELPS